MNSGFLFLKIHLYKPLFTVASNTISKKLFPKSALQTKVCHCEGVCDRGNPEPFILGLPHPRRLGFAMTAGKEFIVDGIIASNFRRLIHKKYPSTHRSALSSQPRKKKKIPPKVVFLHYVHSHYHTDSLQCIL